MRKDHFDVTRHELRGLFCTRGEEALRSCRG